MKRKLVWLGSQSYLFRLFFARYMKEQARGKISIAHTDAFICQECTEWSGLGAIDVLAGVLDISDDDRKDLRSWYERHVAPYKILSVNNKTLEALNVINDQPYRVRINMKNPPFKRGQLVFGSLVPWRGEWYWSGEQRLLGDSSKVDVEQLKRSMKRNSSAVVCRYSKEHETKVRQLAAKQYDLMMKYHEGNDLAWYPDGLSMAADWEKETRWQWELRSPREIDEVVQKHHLEKGRPEMNLPKDLLEHKDGIGVFINPDEGKEIMTSFNALVEGLQRKGEALTEDQEDAIRGFIFSDNLSPRFVKRVLEQYGSEFVKAVFVLQGDLPDYWLDYLIRRYKGRYFRKYYPSISLA
ncbi:MAG: hypothetical protein HUU20_03575 [Pirellulales bacterium]|nr:hypothetical protein [Pirellulales bacterium]